MTVKRTRRKALSKDDIAVWRHVAQGVKPLDARRELPDVTEPDAMPELIVKSAPMKKPVTVTPALPKPKLPPIAPIEKRLRQKVVRGSEPISARLDLHGLTQDAAHQALNSFLRGAQRDGHKLVIVITGKGGGPRSDHDHYDLSSGRGILRRVVPQWLRLPELRAYVIGFEEAHQGHGGEGALYVRIRRAKGLA